jgi:hypothetical protein
MNVLHWLQFNRGQEHGCTVFYEMLCSLLADLLDVSRLCSLVTDRIVKQLTKMNKLSNISPGRENSLTIDTRNNSGHCEC